MHAISQHSSERETLYEQLMSAANDLANDHTLACMLASWTVGEGALPARMGLSDEAFRRMLDRHFVTPEWDQDPAAKGVLDLERIPERDELVQLMIVHRAEKDESEKWIAEIVAAACMGSDHLWQDLGLWSRKDLSALMQTNFPSLAAKNDRDMKWKKFLYKQLCIQEGIYTCRSPSCEVCADYAQCFGPEE